MKETGERKPPEDMPNWNAFVKNVLADRKSLSQTEKRGATSEQKEKGNTRISLP